MCGIVGVFSGTGKRLSHVRANDLLKHLLIESQSRGKDSSGVAVVSSARIDVLKECVAAGVLIQTREFSSILAVKDQPDQPRAVIGHARMETNGSFASNSNNQPVAKSGCLLIHNGIIVNDAELWAVYPMMHRQFEVDSEIIADLLQRSLKAEANRFAAVRQALAPLKGAFTIAALFEDRNQLLLATNTGSLYLLVDAKTETLVAFASEYSYLDSALAGPLREVRGHLEIRHVAAGQGIWVNLENFSSESFLLDGEAAAGLPGAAVARSRSLHFATLSTPIRRNRDERVDNRPHREQMELLIQGEYERDRRRIDELVRCSRCILPETMPYIFFDSAGVCNYCYGHQPRETRGQEALLRVIEPFRRTKGQADCIVSFSGGRDSSYALHYAKTVLGLNPVAYSYDWGMLTDLGRRNQARMTGALGVEHVLVSADIQRKRNNIRKNILAWLRRPSLGVVPLFMAGDKQYFYHLNRLRKEMGIDLVLYADNALEKTDFKYGFADVKLSSEVGKAYNIGRFNSAKLLWYYAREFMTNAGYINSSLFDTMTAYLSSYVVPKEYVYLFRYILWEEREIERTIIGRYEWELAADTTSSWRIGDGTAAFYNYIYYTMAGLTEQDTFRSNQIRENVIGREEGLRLAQEGNQPRMESFLWYCDTIGLDVVATVRSINAAKKRYAL